MLDDYRSIIDSELVKRLFTEHLDGVILIDCKTQALLKISDDVTGKLLPLVTFDGTPYDDQMDAIIGKIFPLSDHSKEKEQLLFNRVVEELKAKSVYDVDFNMLDQNGRYAFHCLRFEYLDDAHRYVIMVSEDVSRIVTGEIDPLTGGLNTEGFHNKVSKWLEKNPGRKYYVIRYNVDHFKDINGVYGHSVGDKLLRDMAECMRAIDSEDAISAHLNADHFVRFCASDVLTAQESYDNFSRVLDNYNLSIPVTLHAGVYDLCEYGEDPYTMSYKALLAMQSIKGDMEKKIAYYEKGMLRQEQERLELLNDVEKGIAENQFEVWFQPQVDYAAKKIIGAEALVRWNHTTRGMLSPGTFIPLLERSNLISKVDRFVFHTTCRYMQKWLSALPNKDVQISINLARQDILTKGFVDTFEGYMKKYNIPRRLLHLEVTESAYIEEFAKLNAEVDKLRALGFLVEIDDFGAGYSSLNTLKDINADKIKLDMKFLSGTGGKKGRLIVAAVINMAKALNMSVLAEGIETKEQADFLLQCGCTEMQGYYFSKPVPLEEYEDILFGRKKLPALA